MSSNLRYHKFSDVTKYLLLLIRDINTCTTLRTYNVTMTTLWPTRHYLHVSTSNSTQPVSRQLRQPARQMYHPIDPPLWTIIPEARRRRGHAWRIQNGVNIRTSIQPCMTTTRITIIQPFFVNANGLLQQHSVLHPIYIWHQWDSCVYFQEQLLILCS